MPLQPDVCRQLKAQLLLRMLGPLTALVLALACCSTYVLAADAHTRSDVSWLIQLSDLHISAHVHHEIVPDLIEFGNRVVRSVKPGAILITGDLVDAKTRVEGSQQNEAEWKAYETVWRHLAQSADLAAAAVLDVRGNHDAFDTLRNTDQDFFAFHSATAAAHGQAAAAAQRVWVHEMQPQLLLPTPHSHHQQQQQQHWRPKSGKRGLQMLSSSSSNSRSLLVQNATRVYPEQQQQHAGSGPHITHRSLSAFRPASSSSSSSSCPSAVLLGLDFTPNVGLHAPANFFGVATGPLLQQIQQQLLLIRTGSSSSSNGVANQAAAAAAGHDPISGRSKPNCRHTVPIISYSHYPFSTVAASYAPSSSIRQQRQQQREGGRAVRDLLRYYDVSAHVSGHLHDLVGQRLHAIYDKPLGAAAAAAAEGDGGSSDDAAAAAGAYFADLESADWKTSRRWRLIVVDSGVLSFADLQFKRTTCSSSDQGCPGGSYTVRSVDSSRSVMSHLAVLTWPPDGRYSPLSAAAAQQQQQDWGSRQQQQDGGSDRLVLLLPVRVWVAPLDLQGNSQAGSSSSSSGGSSSFGVGIAEVQLHYGCQGINGHQSLSSSSSSRRMHPIGIAAKSSSSSGSGSSSSEEYPYTLTGPQVFGTDIRLDPQELLLLCGSSDSSSSSGVVLQLQVIVTDTSGSSSTSELRPVLLPLGHWQQQQQQQEQDSAFSFPIAAAAARLPLGNGLFEWLIIVFDGISFGYWLFYMGWLCQVVGLLIMPKLLGRHILSANAAVWRALAGSSSSSSNKKGISSSTRSFLWTNKQQQQQQQDDDYYDVVTPSHKQAVYGGSSSSSSSRSLQRHSVIITLLLQALAAAVAMLIRTVGSILLLLLLLLLLPAAAMAVLARHHNGLWCCMLAHALFVQWGPWFVAQMSSSSSGWGVWFRYGLLLPLPADLAAAWVGGDPLPPDAAAAAGSSDVQQQYVWLPTPDTYTMSSLYMCLVLAPVTVWFGLVVSAWHQAAATQIICSSSNGSSAAAGELELAAAPEDTESSAARVDNGDVTVGYSSSSSSMNSNGQQPQQQRGVLAGSGSGPTRTRSNTQFRNRASLELPITAAADDAADGKRSDAAAITSSGSSSAIKSGSLGDQEDEMDALLPAAAAATGALGPTAAAAAVIGGITRTGSAWLINLLPLGLVPGAAAAAAPAAAVTSPTARSAAAAAAAAANAFIKLPKPKLSITTLIPTLLWYIMGIVALVLRVVGRALHMSLMATRLPVHLLLLLLPVAYLWYRCCWRLGAAYGPVSLLVSPVIGWLPVFVILALRHVRKRLAAAEARRKE